MTCRGPLDTGLLWGCGKSFNGPTKLVRHFWSKTGRNCVKALWDQEFARPKQSSTATSIPSLKDMPTDGDIEECLPPIILDHIPDLAGIDIREAFRNEGAQDGGGSPEASGDSATLRSMVVDSFASTKRPFEDSDPQTRSQAEDGTGITVQPEPLKRRRLSL